MPDWLDSQLAEEAYLPDDGFTARVTAALPAARSSVQRLRVLVLGPTLALAFALLVVEAVASFGPAGQLLSGLGLQAAPLLHHADRGLLRVVGDSFAPLGGHLALLLPALIASTASVFAALPLIRRWV